MKANSIINAEKRLEMVKSVLGNYFENNEFPFSVCGKNFEKRLSISNCDDQYTIVDILTFEHLAFLCHESNGVIIWNYRYEINNKTFNVKPAGKFFDSVLINYKREVRYYFLSSYDFDIVKEEDSLYHLKEELLIFHDQFDKFEWDGIEDIHDFCARMNSPFNEIVRNKLDIDKLINYEIFLITKKYLKILPIHIPKEDKIIEIVDKISEEFRKQLRTHLFELWENRS